MRRRQFTIRGLLILVAVIALTFAAYRRGSRDAREERFQQLARATPGSQSLSIRVRVLASDNLGPVAGATIEATLIGDDGGDGGFAQFVTDAQGVAVIDQALWPGRYQIYLRPPQQSRYHETTFTIEETMLVVCNDGSYSPTEFRLGVNHAKP